MIDLEIEILMITLKVIKCQDSEIPVGGRGFRTAGAPGAAPPKP